jgi:hypothetical protein
MREQRLRFEVQQRSGHPPHLRLVGVAIVNAGNGSHRSREVVQDAFDDVRQCPLFGKSRSNGPTQIVYLPMMDVRLLVEAAL